MKVIFLDIDGVLNSFSYRKKMGMQYYSEMIDRSKMPLLKAIVDATDAKIVLSSTWRKFWNETDPQADSAGQYFSDIFAEYGLRIYGKTPVQENAGRNGEIQAWLNKNRNVDSYVILDDKDFGWSSRLKAHFVQTDLTGNGLEESQLKQVIDVLNNRLQSVEDYTVKRKSDVNKWFRIFCKKK